MRILTGIDAPFKPFGGSFIVCNDWYSDLPDGVEVRFLTLPSPTDEKWWSIKDVKFLDIVKTKTAEEYPEYLRKLRDAVEAEIADFKPDIIHGQHLNYGLSRVFADLELDIPKLGICHGTDVQAAANSEFFKENLIRICDGLDELVFPNQPMADDLFEVYPNKAKPYIISPLGIPDRYYDQRPERQPFSGDRQLKVLYAGRLLAWKGADIAVEAMAYAREDMHLTVIGNEDQAGYVQPMHDFVRSHGLEGKVAFMPMMTRDDLLESFTHYDVIVLPSRRLEAFSLTVIEAQAMGLPVVYAAGGGIVSTVGEGGLRLNENTPEELARTLDRLVRDPAMLAALQGKGWANAESYRVSAAKQRLFKRSEELIAQRAGRTLQES